MALSILTMQHNMMAMNGDRMLGLEKAAKAKSTEKLSSGYKINRAADDAAGLAISEKLRRIIRGLSQGTENAQDGISWVQTGDGALEEAQEILQRMNELAVKSANGTNSVTDRTATNDEFSQLKKELNRISATTKFNDMKIFSNHKPLWYQTQGNKKWNPYDQHIIEEGKNELIIKYYPDQSKSSPQELTFTVPPGRYNTLELLDELDTAIMEQMGGYESWFEVEYAADGHININLEGGAYIESVTGDLSYLLYEMYKGGGTGALLGTTIFTTDTDKLNIIAGKNDYMKFFIEDLKGNQTPMELTIPEGSYTRDEVMDKLNELLKDTSVRATAYGRSIKLGSNKEFVTGFIGNMFSIDGPDYTSVFYDNVKNGSLSMYEATFKGGSVMISDGQSFDEEHKLLTFDSTNNELILQPDGCDAPVKITIDEGSYSLANIWVKLQRLFDDAGLALDVGTWSESVPTASADSPYGTRSSTFYGLTITTKSKGPDSKIGIDSSSSAYNTLFVDRSYIYYGPKASTRGDVTANSDARFTGSKNLGNVTAQTPLTLTSDNNSFSVSVKGTDDASSRSAVISLDAKTYDSSDAIVDEVNAQLANAGLDDLIKAQLSTSNTLELVEAAGGDVNGYINVSTAAGSNGITADKNGYLALFVEQTVIYDPKTVSNYGSISFDTPGEATEDTLTITVKGKPYQVKLDGIDKSDPAQIAQKINDTIKGETITSNNTFSSKTHGGTTTDNNFSTTYPYYSTYGNTNVAAWNPSPATGTSGSTEGATGGKPSTAATLTVGPKLKAEMNISAANNTIRLTINDRTETLVLSDGKYTQKELCEELQKQINAHFGTGSAGATVTLDNAGDHLVITSGLVGKDSKVACGTNDSTFLADLNTTKTGASCTSPRSLSNSFTITDGVNDKFVFKYREPGASADTTCELDLSGGSYDRSKIVKEINDQLKAKGLDSKIEASLSGGNLRLTTKGEAVGTGTRISFSTTDSTAADAMFGGLIDKQPAYVNTTLAIQDKITIEAGKQEFTLKVDNTADGTSNPQEITVTLAAKTYNTRDEFLTELNNQLAGKGITASLASSNFYDSSTWIPKNSLQFTTTAAGSGISVDVAYISPETNSKSVMQAIYGTSSVNYPAVEASFDADNKLTITAVKADGSKDTSTSVSVTSTSSAGLLEGTPRTQNTPPTSTSGYHSRTKAAIDGVSFSSYKLDGVDTAADTVTIDKYNNDLSFYVYYNGSYASYTYFSLTLDQKTYTYGELQQALQDKLDAAGSPVAGKVNVTVNDDGVKIEAKDYGNAFQFRNLQGDFYYKILSAGEEIHEKETATDKDGYQVVNGAYTIGRKDVSGGVEIVDGICDELSFNLILPGDKTETLSMVLNPGKYNAQELIKEVQSKVDEQLVKRGLNPGLVEVNIGGIDSGIAGNNDHNALNFRISNKVQAPLVGEYLIEGVTGNAAFEIFYQTEGKIIPAYTMGSKNVVSQGVTIHPGNTDLTIAVDDDVYTINLKPGTYTGQGIVNALNEAFGEDIPLSASINREDGRVKISYAELGHHEFKYIIGGAKDDVFFNERGGRDNTYRNIQLSSEIPDYIPIKRSEFNTNMLRISSLNILDERYALKAIDRLTMAINRVSSLRTDFGVTQNRLEHAINSNRNKEENVTAADSRIRDTDIAKEMVKLSNLNILEQAGISILAQTNQSRSTILSLLG